MQAQTDIDLIALLAAGGRTIALICESQDASNEIGEAITDAAPACVRRYYRVNGQQRVEFKSGGQVLLMSRRGPNRLYGRTLDMIVIDDHRYLQDEDFMMAIVPCFATAPGGHPRIGILVI